MEKQFKGKAIYNPSGKAGEYSYWACNFYVGCSNGCTYCYCKKGMLGKALGGDKPVLKKCFKGEDDALPTFQREIQLNMDVLREHGIFFSFTTDPMIPETIALTQDAIGIAQYNKIPCKILTKNTEWVNDLINDWNEFKDHDQDLIAYGFTLTGHDELEPGANTNTERIEALKKLHEAGFKTFASIEPIVDFESSLRMIKETVGFCDLYKIGLMSGKKYDRKGIREFIISVLIILKHFYSTKIYFKDSLLKQAGVERINLPDNCVGRDYKLHES